ncbi:hypothetical protein M8Z33_07575 [Streptomyces sp. ZAF1911]|uniref:hypothetical protein n=1 Tax=Streptomyces sp. ZAF1911 TaxID=2944129 RepID=UPI00237A2C24|nr:hypothetical protein [Streptomyces sp. ZAF1911]MDD9376534.1 hypothetical protein [Streptomyces sp. ZAF1911]
MDVLIVRSGVPGAAAVVHLPFELREVIKAAVPSHRRTWDAKDKVWRIHEEWIPVLRRALEDAGHRVRLDGVREEHTAASVGDWPAAMYRDLGAELGGRAFKALLLVLHPDRGGSLAAMQALNAARALYGKPP